MLADVLHQLTAQARLDGKLVGIDFRKAHFWLADADGIGKYHSWRTQRALGIPQVRVG